MFELLSVQVMVMLLLGACWGNGVVKRSDDVTPVEIVVQQQAMTIQSLQAHLSTLQQSVASLTSRLASVETEIQQDHHKQAAFHVRFAGAYNVPLDVGAHAILRFNSVTTNLGNGYNPETGLFTAPYAGAYLFLLDATHIPDHTLSSQLAIMKTGHHVLAATYGKAQSLQADSYTRDTVQAAVHLKVGEQVWVEHVYGATVFRQSSFTTFTGVLVQAD